MPEAIDQFAMRVVESGLLSPTEMVDFVAAIPAPRRPTSAAALCDCLVQSGHMTAYQADCLLGRTGHPLVMGEYLVLDRIGEGGMGLVLKCQHRRMKRVVAMKLLSGASLQNADGVQRFYREVEAAARLAHPNIVTAYDAGECEGLHYLVMEFVEGRDLSAHLKEAGPLPVAAAVDCIVQTARGLRYAHAQGVVHRDIKPANLLLDRTGAVKILDMGLARLNETGFGDPEARGQLTQTGQMMGTLDYMSPEQAEDTRLADARSDIYSLGCTLFKLIAGEPLFEGETMMKKLLAHRDRAAPALHQIRPDVPEALNRVFQRMVAKQPAHRQQSMDELLDELRAACGAIVRADSDTDFGEFAFSGGARGARVAPDQGSRTPRTVRLAAGEETAVYRSEADTGNRTSPLARLAQGGSASNTTHEAETLQAAVEPLSASALSAPPAGGKRQWLLLALGVAASAAAGVLLALNPWGKPVPLPSDLPAKQAVASATAEPEVRPPAEIKQPAPAAPGSQENSVPPTGTAASKVDPLPFKGTGDDTPKTPPSVPEPPEKGSPVTPPPVSEVAKVEPKPLPEELPTNSSLPKNEPPPEKVIATPPAIPAALNFLDLLPSTAAVSGQWKRSPGLIEVSSPDREAPASLVLPVAARGAYELGLQVILGSQDPDHSFLALRLPVGNSAADLVFAALPGDVIGLGSVGGERWHAEQGKRVKVPLNPGKQFSLVARVNPGEAGGNARIEVLVDRVEAFTWEGPADKLASAWALPPGQCGLYSWHSAWQLKAAVFRSLSGEAEVQLPENSLASLPAWAKRGSFPSGVSPPLAPEPPWLAEGWVDLLAKVSESDPLPKERRDLRAGELFLAERENAGGAFAEFTYPPPANYELFVRFTPQSKYNKFLSLVLPLGEKGADLTLAEGEGEIKHVAKQLKFRHSLKAGAPHSLLVRVSATGTNRRVRAELDGHEVLNWNGPLSDLAFAAGWFSSGQNFAVGTIRDPLVVHALRVRPLAAPAN